jgi:glycosyltransferase involved in cell wall biosynthesis
MVSAIVLTKNEEKNIEDCLDTLSWCDEVIVIDDNSIDKTVALAKKKSAQVFIYPLKNNFSQQRNFGLEKAKGDWVLFVDADERVSSALWYEIMEYTNNAINNYSGFYLKRIDSMWGKFLRYGETGNITLLRLAKKDAGKWEGKVHEKWQIKGNTVVLHNVLSHYPHQTIKDFLKEINYYTDLRAAELFDNKVKVRWSSIIFYPKAKFILNYFLRLGFLDGLPGLVFALMMSFHSFLVRAKLWLLWQKK